MSCSSKDTRGETTTDSSSRERYVVLDRDGTVIEEKGYLSDPDQVELIPGAARGLRQLRHMGLGLVLVTNQSGVGRGFFDEESLNLVHQRMVDLLRAEGVQFDGIFFCTHRPSDGCLCRKPRPGLLERAAADLGFDPARCFVVGDKSSDVELGRTVGATTFLVWTGYGAQTSQDGRTRAHYTVNGLTEVAEIVRQLLGLGE